MAAVSSIGGNGTVIVRVVSVAAVAERCAVQQITDSGLHKLNWMFPKDSHSLFNNRP